jgi:hypothetical protein
MPPILSIKRSSVISDGDSSPTYVQPSTWKVMSVIGGTMWFTYTIYSSAKQIWEWIQGKLEARNRNRARQMKPHRLRKRIIHSKVIPTKSRTNFCSH